MAIIYVADVVAYNPALGAPVTLRFATQGYVTAPGDSPSNTYYDGRIQQPGNVQRTAFSGARTSGASKIGFGELVLVNIDGALDALIDYGFDGRQITIRRGEVTPDSDGAATWITTLAGTMEQAEFGWNQVTIRVRDRQYELNKPIQLNRYAGNNALPNGVEGVQNDLMGKAKPRLYGTAYNIPVPCVNTSKLIYQVHDGALQAVLAVTDRGGAVSFGANFATNALLQAATVASGTYATCLAEGFIRLGSSPVGLVTCDAVQGAASSDRTVAQILRRMLLDAGIAAGDILDADVAALDCLCSYEVGFWAPSDTEVTFISAMDAIANSIGAWYGQDRTGIFRMGRIVAPGSPAAATLTGLEITKIDRVASADEGNGVPAFRVNLGYKRFFVTQDGDFNASVTDARRAELREEYRRVKSEDLAVKTVHLLAPELTFDTHLVNPANAQAEADRRRDLYKVRRDRLEVRVALDATLIESLDIGVVVSVQVNRFNYGMGKKFLIIGLRTNLRGVGTVDLTLWG